MEWYKCRPRKLLDACEGLGTAALVSTYRTIIDRIYECDGPISNDPSSIGRYAGLRPSHAAKAISELIELGKLFRTDDGKLSNRFANNELEERAELGEKRAAAGSKGGRSRVQGGANGDQGGTNGDQGGKKPKRENAGTAENGQLGQAIASTRAQEKRREEKKESPQPPKGPDEDDGQQPDEPLTAEDRARLARNVAGVAERPPIPEDRIAKLTGEIMRLAKMTAPPIDLVLVERWITLGLDDDEILQIVSRMSAGARGSIRAFRYFDAEIKRQHEARGSADEAHLAEFKRISQRAQSP